jgi:D-beta-D-heptose 7-phosphate kinase/D-beta-D-heptose 1-phosphate adenosyltransferase
LVSPAIQQGKQMAGEAFQGGKQVASNIGKQLGVGELELQRKRIWKESNKEVVFTNGCFDILHAAHLHLLHHLRNIEGDCVVVGVNSDDSVKRLKGTNRPINDIFQRTEALKALSCVDFIVVFSENTPYTIMKNMVPHTIVKGGDYKKEDIVGADIANNVVLFNYMEGYSTSSIIEKSHLSSNV